MRFALVLEHAHTTFGFLIDYVFMVRVRYQKVERHALCAYTTASTRYMCVQLRAHGMHGWIVRPRIESSKCQNQDRERWEG